MMTDPQVDDIDPYANKCIRYNQDIRHTFSPHVLPITVTLRHYNLQYELLTAALPSLLGCVAVSLSE